jgi:hypothetical protein
MTVTAEDVRTVRAVHASCHKRLTELTVAPTGCWNEENPANAYVVEYDRRVAERKRMAEEAQSIRSGGLLERLWENGRPGFGRTPSATGVNRALGMSGPRPQWSRRRPNTEDWSWQCRRCGVWTPRITEAQLLKRVLAELRVGGKQIVIS